MIQYNEELFDKDLKNQDEKDYHISVLDKDNEYLDNEDFHKE